MSKYQISQQGIDEIKRSEKLELAAYQDLKGVWTIGYGHTGKVNGKSIGAGMKITEEQAEQLLRSDLDDFERTVNKHVKVPLNQPQYDSLVSLAFNIGGGNFKDSTLLRRLNQGNYQAAADQMLVWNKSAGKYRQGLMNRRERERAMFLGDNKPIDKTMPMPSSIDEEIDAPINPLQNFSQATPLDQIMQSHEEPINDHQKQQQALAQSFYQLNDTFGTPEQAPTLTAFEPPEPPDYSEKLASAFGIAPSTQGKIPDYIGDMIKSIYDQTA